MEEVFECDAEAVEASECSFAVAAGSECVAALVVCEDSSRALEEAFSPLGSERPAAHEG